MCPHPRWCAAEASDPKATAQAPDALSSALWRVKDREKIEQDKSTVRDAASR